MQKNDGRSQLPISFSAVFLAFLLLCTGISAAQIKYDPGKRRDPFVPLKGEEAQASGASAGFKLEGIIYDPGGRSLAILDGKSYMAGETIGNAKIVKIMKDRVVILVNEAEKTFRIREEE